jgi:hypothetical protein
MTSPSEQAYAQVQLSIHQAYIAILKLGWSSAKIPLTIPALPTGIGWAGLGVAIGDTSTSFVLWKDSLDNVTSSMTALSATYKAELAAQVAADNNRIDAALAQLNAVLQQPVRASTATVTIIGQFKTPLPVPSNVDMDKIFMNGESFTFNDNSWVITDAPTLGSSGGALKVSPGQAYGAVPPGVDPTKPPTKPINVAAATAGSGGATSGSGSTTSGGGSKGTGIHGSGPTGPTPPGDCPTQPTDCSPPPKEQPHDCECCEDCGDC